MVIVFAALFGLAIGSFLNVVVFRTHADIPLTGRSKCLICEQPISWFDLVPVLSFFLLRGRCRRCKGAINWQYPLVEVATTLLVVLIAWQTWPDVSLLLRDVILGIFLIIIFVYDLKYGYILDRFTVPGMILAVVFNFALGIVSVESMALGAFVVGGFFALQYFVSKGKWIGGGDIRLGVMMGLILGLWPGVLALFIGYVLGAVVAVGLLVRGRTLKSAVPFGTFLTVGTVAAMLWGEKIIDWYLWYFL
ncbi:MAG: prepilin peptidase [Patescibacteria group bacterium]